MLHVTSSQHPWLSSCGRSHGMEHDRTDRLGVDLGRVLGRRFERYSSPRVDLDALRTIKHTRRHIKSHGPLDGHRTTKQPSLYTGDASRSRSSERRIRFAEEDLIIYKREEDYLYEEHDSLPSSENGIDPGEMDLDNITRTEHHLSHGTAHEREFGEFPYSQHWQSPSSEMQTASSHQFAINRAAGLRAHGLGLRPSLSLESLSFAPPPVYEEAFMPVHYQPFTGIGSLVKVLYRYNSQSPEQITVAAGEVVVLLSGTRREWAFVGRSDHSQRGYVPTAVLKVDVCQDCCLHEIGNLLNHPRGDTSRENAEESSKVNNESAEIPSFPPNPSTVVSLPQASGIPPAAYHRPGPTVAQIYSSLSTSINSTPNLRLDISAYQVAQDYDTGHRGFIQARVGDILLADENSERGAEESVWVFSANTLSAGFVPKGILVKISGYV